MIVYRVPILYRRSRLAADTKFGNSVPATQKTFTHLYSDFRELESRETKVPRSRRQTAGRPLGAIGFGCPCRPPARALVCERAGVQFFKGACEVVCLGQSDILHGG
jgi:hypothetical protein